MTVGHYSCIGKIKECRKYLGYCCAGQRYDAAKAFARDHQTYVTAIIDQQKAWREKFERRRKNLTQGFFADKTKPYQSVGTVYLESGDLMLNSITSDVRTKVCCTQGLNFRYVAKLLWVIWTQGLCRSGRQMFHNNNNVQ